MNLTFEVVQNEHLEEAFTLLRELRTELSREAFFSLYDQARTHDRYEILAAREKGRMVGLAGYRILYDFVHGKHLYVDDLVVHDENRGNGIGAALLSAIQGTAREMGVEGLRLSTGTGNDAAKRFYEREGWLHRSETYKMRLEI